MSNLIKIVRAFRKKHMIAALATILVGVGAEYGLDMDHGMVATASGFGVLWIAKWLLAKKKAAGTATAEDDKLATLEE